jgi:hypothetical protein
MTRSRPCVLALAPLLATLTSCATDGYEVVVRFEPEALAREVETVEVAVVARCADHAAADAEVDGALAAVRVRRGAAAPALGELRAGSFGLLARGRDGACRVVAYGCRAVELEAGGEGRLEVVLGRVDGPPCPAGTWCVGDACEPIAPDADVDDAAADVDVADAETPADADARGDADLDADPPPHDADEGRDATPDADPPCDCRIDGECRTAGEVDPDDPCQGCDPSRSTTAWRDLPDGEPCVNDGGAGVCRIGALGNSTCCSGCWALDRVLCVPGNTNLACGHGGGGCVPCVAPERCDEATGTCETP